MLLQVALDKPEHLGILPALAERADIVEIGTPLLKRFGVSAITTARELCPGTAVLADTKTVDGGQLEAEMVFGAGAAMMTVLATAPAATRAVVAQCATRLGASAIVDTITESGKERLLPRDFALDEGLDYIAVHSPTDTRLAGERSRGHIEAVGRLHDCGFLVSLAGGIGPDTIDDVVAARPEIVVVGTAITESNNPGGTAAWLRSKLVETGRGWPSDAK